ncbi:MAG: AlpA family phage regulatory protein [Pseudomonadota bacterium]
MSKRQQVLRIRQVCAKLSISRSSLYEKISPQSGRYDASFPRPFKIGGAATAVGFLEESIDAWILRQAAATTTVAGVA